MPDPPSPYPALFLFYPARRRSDRWAINELKRPSFFFGQRLALSVRRTAASPSPLHHPSYSSHNPHSRDEYSLSFSFPLHLIFPRFFSLPHTYTFSLSRFSRPFRSFRCSPLRSDLSISISHSLPFPSACSSPLSFFSTHLLHLLPTLILFVPRPTRHSTVGRNGLEAVLFARFFILCFSVSLPSAYLTLSLSSLSFPIFLSFSPTRTGHPSLSGFPRSSRARTRGRVRASHMHLHACRSHVSRSRIAR